MSDLGEFKEMPDGSFFIAKTDEYSQDEMIQQERSDEIVTT